MSAGDCFRPPDGLGDRSAARYRHFRRFVEAQHGEQLDQTLFGLLLGAESMRDEMRTYEEQPSSLVRLAQTGHFVRQLQRLNRILDEASASYDVGEPRELKNWTTALEMEREARMDRFNRTLAMLERKRGQNGDEREWNKASVSFLDELETEEQQEEVLTLLKAVIDNYADDVLTPHETQTIVRAFTLVAENSNVCVLSLPAWFIPVFEFGSTFGLSRWGNDQHISDHSDPTGFIQEADMWSSLNHPYMAKFLGASHVGSRKVIAHEKLRPLSEYIVDVKDQTQVWRRLHELTLGLQYLHERGLSCRLLSIDRLKCTQYEAKLVLLGPDLHAGDADKSVQSRQQSDLQALGAAILNVLHEVDSPPDPANGDETKRNRFEFIPTERPAFVAEAEWAVIEQLHRFDPDPTRALLRVMTLIEPLAGISKKSDVLENIQSTDWDRAFVDGKVDIGRITVYTGEYLPVAKVLSDCEEWSGDDSLSRPVHVRLADVCTQLCQRVDHQPEEEMFKKAIAHFIRLLNQFYQYLKPKHSPSVASAGSLAGTFASIGTKVGGDDPGTLVRLHVDIDRVLRKHDLDGHSVLEHLWKPQLRELWSDAQSASLEMRSRVASVRDEQGREASADQGQQDTLALLGRSISKYKVNPWLNSQQRADATSAWFPLIFSRWFISPSEVDFEPHPSLGAGSFGSVHFGRWFDTPVVVKRVLANPTRAVLAQFRQEADVWFRLNHINVVKMYGACDLGEPFFVCEYASGGDLNKYVEQQGRSTYLIWYSLLNAALGLQYLHDNGIVHGDLKANNILVGADDVAKLADFGLSVSTRGGTSENGGGAQGAYRWKAPEHIAGAMATFAADVYSFAMVMIEVVTGQVPWHRLPDVAVMSNVADGRIPRQPMGIEDKEWRLIQRMCCFEPTERVTIDTVVAHLTSLIDGVDRTTWQLSVQGLIPANPYKNRVQARGGALMSLLSLATSNNTRLSALAADHLAAVHINRNTQSEQREVDVIVSLLAVGSDAGKQWAADALWRLALSNATNKKLIAAAGAIEPLVKLLFDGNDEQKFQAVGALFNLASDGRNKTLIAEAGGIAPLIALLSNTNDDLKTKVAGVLRNLAINPQNKETIARAGAIPLLVALVREGAGRQKEQAAAALSNLVQLEANRHLIVDADGIKPLVQLVRRGNNAEKERAAGTLMYLSMSACNNGPIAAAGGIGPVVELIRSGTVVQKNAAAHMLQNISANPRAVPRIVTADGIAPLVSLVQNGTTVQKINAAITLSRLARGNTRNQSLIADADGVAPLVNLVRDGSADDKLHAVIALINLFENNERNQKLVAGAGGVDPLVALVRDGTADQKKHAAVALTRLAWNNEPNQILITDCDGVKPLVALVRDGDNNRKREAVAALAVLSMHPRNKRIIIQAGGVTPLVLLLLDGTPDERSKVAVALFNIQPGVPTRTYIPVNGVIPVLIKNVARGTDDQQLLAAVAMGYLEVKIDTQAIFTANGGFDVLLDFIQRADAAGKEKGLLALERFCRNVGTIIRDNVMAVRGVAILSELAKKRGGRLQELAGLVLAQLEIARNPEKYVDLPRNTCITLATFGKRV